LSRVAAEYRWEEVVHLERIMTMPDKTLSDPTRFSVHGGELRAFDAFTDSDGDLIVAIDIGC
jgi:hypothetical protein